MPFVNCNTDTRPHPAMAESKLRQTQFAFAKHIRDPRKNPLPPGLKPERMAMYRELFFNNISSFISTGFPVLREVLDEGHWLALVEDFFAHHRSTTPYFADFSQEFLHFLREERAGHPEDPPFLLELAHYEWVELALQLSEGEPPPMTANMPEDLLSREISLSELALPLAYRFPVHKINREFQPVEAPAEPTCLVVYRDRNDEVHFVELNAPTYRLLQLLEAQGTMQAESCLRQIAQELEMADPSPALAYGTELLRDLGLRGIVAIV